MSVNFLAHMLVDNSEKNYDRQHLVSRERQEGAETMTKSSDIIKSTLGNRKGLLVIDCVDKIDQLKDIGETVGWFGSGSRFIFTTQEKILFHEFGVEHVYEVKSLRYDEALQLFSQSAFKRNALQLILNRVLFVQSRLLTSFLCLGSSLQYMDEKSWEEALQKLQGDEEKNYNASYGEKLQKSK